MNRHKAYTEMLERHRTMVWRLCLQHSRGDMDRCHDLMQEVTIALWLHFDQLRPDATPHEERAWVCWQCRSTLDLLRRKEHLTLHPMPDGAAECLPADDNEALREEVDDLMASLSADEQQIMRWQMEGYRADEIANLMGIGRNTVYQRVYRAVAKMRRVALLLLALLAATAVAVAIVPQWHQRVFGGGEPAADTVPVSVPVTLSPATSIVGDSIGDTVVTHRTWIPPEPIPYLVPVADTVLPVPVPSIAGPCGCPDSAQGGVHQADCIPFDDTDEEQQEEEADVTIRVAGNIIVVEGVRDERVDVFDSRGRLVATARCDDHCMLTIGMQDYSYSPTTTSGTNTFWVQVGDRPRQQVFIDQLPRGNPMHPIPASTQRILMF